MLFQLHKQMQVAQESIEMASAPVDTTERSIEYQPSETAMATAFLRALSAHDEREEIRGSDYLAELFLTEERKRPLKDSAVRQWVLKNKTAPGMYEFMIARSAFFDDLVEQGLRENIPQIVFLGAGYDSRPYRFADLIRETRIFELDAPPTQQRKREILDQASIAIPKQVIFVPIIFNTTSLSNALMDAGFDRNQKTLFVWEGVTYYLSSGTVDDTLNSIKSISPAGSSVCFDYAALSSNALNEEGVIQVRGILKMDHSAEPTRFGIPAGTIESFLSKRGYAIKEHLTSDEIEKRYLVLRDGSTAGKLPGLLCFACSSV
jgi:methyltransferase (TIGR00027 family)